VKNIPFSQPYSTGSELRYISEAMEQHHLSGDGPFTNRCHKWLERITDSHRALLTHSATAGLEMAALLLDVKIGDEVIMPSYTFSSTANAFALRGGVPVFVDIRSDTLNLDESLIEAAISPRTRAIVVMHYAGIACDMASILAIAAKHGVPVIEDAAQGICATYKGKALGALGDIGIYSFHATKNIISGEGGAILVNRDEMVRKAEIIREKGTDRSQFLRGEVDKYSWRLLGSSYLPNELTAAYLWAQLENAKDITEKRVAVWNRYHELCAPLEAKGLVQLPHVPNDCAHNGHLYYVLANDQTARNHILQIMKSNGVQGATHYVPLHQSGAGVSFGKKHGDLKITESVAVRLLRLPLWVGLTEEDISRVVDSLTQAFRN
jgi:dTDP-4-amino-4,6-dideoxygalactose transaminase